MPLIYRRLHVLLIVAFIIAAAVVVLHSTPARAAAIVVNSAATDGDANIGDGICNIGDGTCTLRAAIETANALPGADTISFNLASVNPIYPNSLPAITDDLTIQGSFSSIFTNDVTIDLEAADSPLIIEADVTVSLYAVVVRRNTDGIGLGGGIRNYGTLTLNRVQVSGNVADSGGGIYNAGTLTIINSNFDGNVGNDYGGGIFNAALGTVTIINSAFLNNTTPTDGAGIYSQNASLTVINSTLVVNQAERDGGAIFNAGGTMTLINNTIGNNRAAGSGGGIAGSGGSGTVNNTLLYHNVIAPSPSGITLSNLTQPTSNCDLSGSYTGDYNLYVTATGCSFGANDLGIAALTPVTDFLLQQLDNFTYGVALLNGSPASNRGSNALLPADTYDLDGDGNTAEPLPVDQRGAGFSRTVFGTTDIGAVEAVCPLFPYTVPAGDVAALITAIDCANTNGAGTNDVINLTPSTYTLTAVNNTLGSDANGLPRIAAVGTAGTLTIDGNGAIIERSTAGGTPDFRLFYLPLNANLTLDDITLRNGRTDFGGAIRSLGGVVTISNSTLTNNVSSDSGGAINGFGGLTVTDSTFSTNTGDSGGAIYFRNATGTNVVTVERTTFSTNNAFNGGAVYLSSASTLQATFTDTTFTGNSATNFGGAAFVSGGSTARFERNTFTGNSGSRGGALSLNTSAHVVNSTFAANTATTDGGAVLSAGVSTITNSTFYGNGAPSGGAILHIAGASLNVYNSILAGSTSGGDCQLQDATNVTIQNTLIQDGSCGVGTSAPYANGNVSGDPLLGTLQNNGGITQTFLLNSGSPAINAGSNALALDSNGAALTTDQRGQNRVQGGTVDMGAVELPAPQVTITANDPNAAETSSDPGSFTITRSIVSAFPLTVTVTIGGTAANDGSDFTPTLPTTFTIPADSAFVEVQITPVDDVVIDPNETLLLTLADGADYDLGVNTSATVTIADNDTTPVITITANDANAAEAGSDPGAFTITRTGNITSPLDVTYSIDGTAASADYTPALPTTVTIPADSAFVEIQITPVDDALVEGAETLILILTDGTSYDLGATTSATVTIADNDVPVVSIATTDTDAAEAGQDPGTFRITRVGSTTADLIVSYTVGGTASAGDYTPALTGSATIPTGSAFVDVVITPLDDATVEANETIILTLSSSAGYTVGTPDNATVTITDNDIAPLPTLSISDVSLAEGSAGTTNFTFTVSLNTPAGVGGVTFDIATADNTATVTDGDFVAQSLTGQTILQGSSNYTFTVVVNGDVKVESTETLFVNITNVVGAIVIDGQGQGSITSDDTPGLAISQTGGTTITTEAGGTDTITVALSAQPTANVVVDVTSANTAEVTVDQAQITFTNANWDQAQTVTVTGQDDAVVDGDQGVNITFAINVAGSEDAWDTLTPRTVTVTNTDDDTVSALPIVSVSATDAAAAEAGGDPGTFVVTRTGGTTGELTVIYTIGGTAANGTDYTPALSGTVAIPDGQTSVPISISPVNDTSTEGDESVLLTLQGSANYTVGTPDNAVVVIADNDGTTTTNTATAAPAPPLCSLIGGGTNRIIRADVPGGLNAAVFCRILVENSVYVQRAAEVGDGTLVNAGIIQAVDVFGFTANGVQVADFNLPITVCLQGSGRMFYRDATNAPRATVPLAVNSTSGYTCASIPNAGTVILVP
jgi:hypothetical protein